MKRHDDNQRGDRLAVTFGDPHESLRARRAYASVPRVGFDGSVMKRHADSQRGGRWPQRHHLRWRRRWRAAGSAGAPESALDIIGRP